MSMRRRHLPRFITAIKAGENAFGKTLLVNRRLRTVSLPNIQAHLCLLECFGFGVFSLVFISGFPDFTLPCEPTLCGDQWCRLDRAGTHPAFLD